MKDLVQTAFRFTSQESGQGLKSKLCHFRSFTLVIVPLWWWNWWGLASLVIIIAAIVWALVKIGLHRRIKSEETQKIVELEAFKTKFYDNLAHEFRTPLTIILGMTSAMKENPRKWFNEGLQMIRRNSFYILHLINQLLDLSKIQADQMTLQPIHGDVLVYLKYILGSFQSYAEAKQIRLHFLTRLSTLPMDYEPEVFREIFSNLLSNAIKFTPEGGNIYLSVQLKATDGKEDTLFVIKDTGIGIEPDKLSRIFDRFYMVDNSLNKINGGTGLGLSLTYELVQLIKGNISVTSTLGEGTSFTIQLPVTHQALPKEAPQTISEIDRGMLKYLERRWDYSESNPARKDLRDYDQPLLLIVEDNLDVITYLKSILESSYCIQTAHNGQEGVEVARVLIPDLILSDVMMPVRNGIDMCRILKHDQHTSHIPIILLTAKGDVSTKISGFESGADAYLVKPFAEDELKVRIHSLLESQKRNFQELVHLAGRQSLSQSHLMKEREFLAGIDQIIHKHLDDETFSIEDVCKDLSMSRAQLHRKLKALTDLSASQYIRSYRLQKAREMLMISDLNISEVAFEVGFKDPSYFTRVFVEEFGLTPSAYRQEAQET